MSRTEPTYFSSRRDAPYGTKRMQQPSYRPSKRTNTPLTRRDNFMSSQDMDVENTAYGGASGNAIGMMGCETTQPIYDHLRENFLVFNFSYQAWLEISNNLSTIPMQHTYMPYFDTQVRRVLSNYMEIFASNLPVNTDDAAFNLLLTERRSPYTAIEIIPGKIQTSNYIILSDNIQTSTGGPNEVSSFVQHSKICRFKKPTNDAPWSYFTLKDEKGDDTPTELAGKVNFLSLPSNLLVANTLHTSDANYLAELEGDYESVEDVQFMVNGKRNYVNTFNGTRPNNPTDLKKQIFPNYVGCSMYSNNYEHEERAVNSKGDAMNRCGLFGKYSETNSLIKNFYRDVGCRQQKNWLRENAFFEILDGGDAVDHRHLPRSGKIILGPPLSTEKLIPGHVFFSQTPFLNPPLTGSDDEISDVFYTAPCRYRDQAYTSEITEQTIIDRIRQHNAAGSGHDLLCMIPIRKSDGSLMKIRASLKFNAECTIILSGRRDLEFEDVQLYSDPVTPAVDPPEGGGSEDAATRDVYPENIQAVPRIQPRKPEARVHWPYYLLKRGENQVVFA